MPNLLQLTLFGSPEVRLHGQSVTGFRSSKAQALLYYLAVTGRPHTRPTLAGLFWGDQPEAAARTSLSKCLSNLRDLVGDALLVDRQTVAFNCDYSYHLDTEHFTATSSTPPTPERIPALQTALALYRGDFLEGFYVRDAPEFEQWVLVQRAHYREAVLQGLHTLANWYEQQGDLPQAITHTRRLLTLEPWREEAHRQLMTRLARSGQRAAALAQFESCRRVLAEELAVEPDAETLALVAAIRADKVTRWQGDKVNQPQDHLVTLSPPHPVSPIPPTPLIGRERELTELGELISNPQCRLITITGAGGMGKTRLALAAAADQSGNFQHGAVFVPLAGVSSAQFLPQAILTALDVPLQGELSPQQQVRAVLFKQERLLVLDNYEHLLPDVELLIDLLHYAPKITLLVTSRERLALQAEYLFEISGLAYPSNTLTPLKIKSASELTTYAAIQLFLQRVRQIQPRFIPSDAEIRAIVRICHISEGLPLALELAAALVRERPIIEIAHKLEQGHRLEVNRLRGVPERHRSMSSAFEFSWQWLSPEEQRVFCALSVFRGGFQAEAVQAVANSSPELLAVFVDKSLLRYRRDPTSSSRYDMHELIRQYASKKLNESGDHETVLSQHIDYFLKLAEAANPELRSPQQKIWLARLEREHDNLRAALNLCFSTNPEMALQFAANLCNFWYLHSYFNEGRSWLTQAIACSSDIPSLTRATAFYGAGKFAWIQGDYEQATNMVSQSLELRRTLSDIEGVFDSLNLLGLIALYQSELDNARSIFEQTLLLHRELGNRFDIAATMSNLGCVAMLQNDHLQAKLLLEEGLAISYLVKDEIRTGICLTNLGYNELYSGNLNDAANRFRKAISVSFSQGDRETVVWCLEGFAEIAAASLNKQNSLQVAACLFGAAQTFRNTLGVPLPSMDRPYYEASLAAIRPQMSEAAFAAAWTEGAAMSVEQAVAYALADPTSG